MTALQRYQSSHAAFALGDSDWLATNRRQALRAFESVGFPSTRSESYKYTSTNALQTTAFAHSGTADHLDVAARAVAEHRLPQAAAEWVFVNGQWVEAMSHSRGLPRRAALHPLRTALSSPMSVKVQPLLAAGEHLTKQPFDALNLAFMQDGVVIELRHDVVLDAPIHLVFVHHAAEHPVVGHPRVLVLAGRGSSATLIEHHLSLTEGQQALGNVVSQVQVQAGAKLDHQVVYQGGAQGFHRTHIQVQVHEHGLYTNGTWAVAGHWIRQDLNITLAKPQAQANLTGLYLPNHREHIDNHTCIEHLAPHCQSRELYKGVVAGRAVFNGKILVHKDAQHTDAALTNRNLVLTDRARVDTKPELEIYADDVRCAHGATVGQLDEQAVYYMRARGIPKQQAEHLLTQAFINELVASVAYQPLRDALQHTVTQRLATLHRSAP